ncbi:MAG TPA: heme o synthase, partial [Anaerolineales bacterium]|nr:heme o synthase [Anaerolineales bacterium]
MTATQSPLRSFRILILCTSIMTFLLIVMGGIVQVTKSGLGCPDWPLCFGRVLPPLRPDAILEYVHRLVALLTGVLILASVVVAWRRFRRVRLIAAPMAIAFGLLVVEIALGAATVLTRTQPAVVAIHLGVALATLAMCLAATVAAFLPTREADLSAALQYRSPFSRLAIWSTAVLFVVLLSGAVVAGSEATKACLGWPLCTGRIFPSDALGWIQMAHRFIVGVAGVLLVILYVRAWLTQRDRIAVFPAAAITTILYFAQAYIGALLVTRDYPPFLLALQITTSAATWAGMVILVVATGLERQPEGSERILPKPASGRQYLKDLLTLTRPVVVLLLLVTAFSAMVIGGKAWPNPLLALWTLLGGGLAAGGAQAVNQYVDRDIDKLMARTAKRPIPAGRLFPAEGLAWGLSLCIISIYLLAGLVNWLAALVTLGGIVYYVLIYTLLLKRTSVQNIVIGGGAGAMAPVVGLVAVTGRLDLWAVFLFAIVFLWTPPHFWALAIVRLKDYTTAKIPMMPVARGLEFTRGQIMLYASILLPVTFLPTLLGIAGYIYLASAVLLG